jgi:hypothetical protein
MDFEQIEAQIALLPPHEQTALLALLEEFEETKKLRDARRKFLPFVKYLWEDFIEGAHHRIIAELYDDVLAGKKNRVIINMAPRHSKSEFASIYLPAFFLGRNPRKKIIQASHTAELSIGFGRRVRNIIDSAEFQKLFPKYHQGV